MERGHIRENPASGIKNLRKAKGAPDANRPRSDAEREAVLEAAPPHMLVPNAVMTFTGLGPKDAPSLVIKYVKRFTDRHGHHRAYLRPPPHLLADGLERQTLDISRADEHAAELIAAQVMGATSAAQAQLSSHARFMIKAARDRAKKCGLTHTINAEWVNDRLIADGFACEVTGIPFDMTPAPGARNAPFRPSLDRINSSLGYDAENIRLVCVVANAALGEWGLEVFLKVAEAAVIAARISTASKK